MFFFVGCYTEKKATNDVNKAQERFPDVVAKKCGDLFKVDTVTQVTSDTMYILGDTLVNFQYDTINNVRTKIVEKLRTITKHEIRTIENKAEIKYLSSVKTKDSIQYLIKEAGFKNTNEINETAIKQYKAKIWRLWLIIALLCLLLIRKPILALIERI
jgi:hypothetical protein